MNSRRIIISVYVVVLVSFGLGAGAVFLDARAQYQQLKHDEQINRQKLADANARLQEQLAILERLKSDPAFVEKVIRRRLRYSKPGEVIFRFEN